MAKILQCFLQPFKQHKKRLLLLIPENIGDMCERKMLTIEKKV